MEPLVALTRNQHIESIHRGAVCVIDINKNLRYHLGNPEAHIYIRSAAKPFQALPLAVSGAIKKFGITLDELAVACGSHSGQPYHLAAVNSILQKIALKEDDLECGSSNPYNKSERLSLIQQGIRPTPIHNCCSGKHALMLALCKYYDFPTKGYTEAQHPVQELICKVLAELLTTKPEGISIGIDGCGVPSYILSMRQLAFLFAQLADGRGNNRLGEGLALIQKAMLTHPEMVSGEGEFCTELMLHTKGRVIGKIGAEGVYGIALPKEGIGIAIKIEDGNERGIYPTVIAILKQLKVINDEAADRLRDWAYPPIKNHKGRVVGYAVPIFTQAQMDRQLKIGEILNWNARNINQ